MPIPQYPYRRIARNTSGRDFVVGDIHACRSLLDAALAGVGFDPDADRLFSTGDLVDRGAEPLESLALLEENWFFSVVGNHERMLRARFGRGERWRTRAQALVHSGDWPATLHGPQRRRLDALIARISDLPAVLEVESGKTSFFVFHAERPSVRGVALSDEQLRQSSVVARHIEALTWGRVLYRQSLESISTGQPDDSGFVRVNASHASRLTYGGHSIVPAPARVGSHVFVDGGAYRQGAGKGSLFLVEHTPDTGPRVAWPRQSRN